MNVNNSDYRRVDAEARIPLFNDTCTATGGVDELSLWVGLGGYFTNKLIQNGQANTAAWPDNSMGAFWEVLNSSYDTHERVVDYNFSFVGDW